jgi:hypothetical protein
MSDAEQRHLVILIHGIRDIARWQSEIRDTLEKHGLAVELTNYGRMNLVEFLIPFLSYFRRRARDKVWTQIRHAQSLHPNSRTSIIAHSFGTYVIAELLEKVFDIRFDKVIFCGSVVRYNLPLEQFGARYNNKIINEVGTADQWPAVAESLTTGYGSAGTYGFHRPGVIDRFFNGARHGYFLSSAFCEKYWVPYLVSGEIVKGARSPENPPLWVRLISIVKIKYVVLVILLLWMITMVLRHFFYGDYYYHKLGSESGFFAWKTLLPTIVQEAEAPCPFDRYLGGNCTGGLGKVVTSYFTGRRYVQVQEFDGDTARQVVSCTPYSFYGRDPVAALERFQDAFKECVTITPDNDTDRLIVRVNKTSLTRIGRSLLCKCDATQIEEFSKRPSQGNGE